MNNSLPDILDGFALNPFTTPIPYVYFPGALAQMDILRRANTYRARMYAIPDDFNQPLQPYETLEYQIKVAGGSYLWGIRFTQYGTINGGTWTEVQANQVVVNVTEMCTGIGLFREFADAQSFSFYTTNPIARGGSIPHLLTQPRLFLEPGDINVELCNLTGFIQPCQLILHFAEPCEQLEEVTA